MKIHRKRFLVDRLTFLVLILALFTSTNALAGMGNSPKPRVVAPGRTVILPQQSPYSLDYAAELTAYFNTSPRHEANYPANLPFQILYVPPEGENNNTGGEGLTFNVSQDTLLYVPILYNDNSSPIIGNFPPAEDRAALLKYFYSNNELGLIYARIIVDGKLTTLGPSYLVELEFDAPLADGATLYQTVAGFLSPLSKGTHTGEISALATGKALKVPPFDQYFPDGVFSFSNTYTVIVH